MKKFFLKLRNRFRKRKQHSVSVSYQKADRIGILVNNPDFSVNEKINDFVNSFRKDGKQVSVICYIDKGANRLYDFPYYDLRTHNISFTGSFKEKEINNFINSDFDYLYSINISPFLPFENILIRSRAKFRIGMFMPGKEKYLDLMFQMGSKPSLPALIDQMGEFTKKIVSNE